jgi:hypothetical protein
MPVCVREGETMSKLRWVELALGLLASVTALAAAAVPLIVPESSEVGRAIVDGQVVYEVHHTEWLVEVLGVWQTTGLLVSIALLGMVVGVATLVHLRRGPVGMVAILWAVPILLFWLGLLYFRVGGMLLEFPCLVMVLCATVATVRQIGRSQTAQVG